MYLKELKNFLLKPLPLIIFIATLQLIIALLPNHLSFDEAMWQYIGHNWFSNGLAPYRGGVDNKSPLIFAVFGLSDKLFGLNCWFPRVLGTVCESVGIYYLYKIAKHVSGELCGIFSITIYGFSLLWKSTDGTSVSFTETYAVTFIIISVYYLLTAQNNRQVFISGLFAAIGFAFRFTAFFGIAAIFLSMLKTQRKFIFSFCAGIILTLVFFIVVMVLSGIQLNDFIAYSLTQNFGQGSVTDRDISWRINSFANTFFYSEIILFYPFVLFFFFLKQRNNFFIIWLICTFTGINVIGIYATTHLKDILPAMALMSGISLAYLVQNYHIPVKPVLIIVWICFFPKLLQPFVDLKHFIFSPDMNAANLCAQPYLDPDDNAKKLLGQWINSNTVSGEKVFVAGYGSIVQAYSKRQSPTIYFNVTQTKTAKEVLFNDLINQKPVLMAIPEFPEYRSNVNSDISAFIDSLAAADYSFGQCMYGYAIYKLKK